MNKTSAFFTAVIFAASLPASAKGVDLPKWNHANDAEYPLVNAQEIRYAGVKPAAKKDDRTKFTVPGQAVAQQGAYLYLGRSENR